MGETKKCTRRLTYKKVRIFHRIFNFFFLETKDGNESLAAYTYVSRTLFHFGQEALLTLGERRILPSPTLRQTFGLILLVLPPLLRLLRA